MTQATTLGELRASGYPDRTVKEELRANLLDRLEPAKSSSPGSSGSTTRSCPVSSAASSRATT